MKKIGLGVVIIACIMWISTGVVMAGKSEACDHPNKTIVGAGHWDVSYPHTATASAGEEWCYATHWVVEEYIYCPDCRHSVLWEVYQHESHSLCGRSY